MEFGRHSGLKKKQFTNSANGHLYIRKFDYCNEQIIDYV